MPATDVDPDTVERLLDEGARLIDVREPAEWSAGHITGAEHKPIGTWDGSEHFEGPTVVMCRSGGRSSRAARILAENGVEVYNLRGGIDAWLLSRRPLIERNGDSGRVA